MLGLTVFPDAALITITALRVTLADLGDTAEIHARIPNPRPDRFVTVNRSGGPRQTIVSDAAQLDVESWDLLPEDAHDLAQLARAAIHAMANTIHGGVQVYFVNEFSGPAELPDPVSNQARYVQSFQVSMRGAAA